MMYLVMLGFGAVLGWLAHSAWVEETPAPLESHPGFLNAGSWSPPPQP